jgi:carbonic anhydrase
MQCIQRLENIVNNLDSMLQRNKEFAAEQSAAGALMPSLPRAMPNVKAVIIGCADMRVDPAQLFELEPGEAVVLRNIGGRITLGLMEELGMLGRIGQVAGEVPGGGGEFHLIVLQHTDCGITRLAGDPAMLTHYFQIQESELKAKAVTDPRAAVAGDVATLGRFPRCRALGGYRVWCTTWRRDLWRLWCRPRRFALRKY